MKNMKNSVDISRRDFFNKLIKPVSSSIQSSKVVSVSDIKDSETNFKSISKVEANEIIRNTKSSHLLKFVPKPSPIERKK